MLTLVFGKTRDWSVVPMGIPQNPDAGELNHPSIFHRLHALF
jgi:hypothetical protein